jgi:hypothetical protein
MWKLVRNSQGGSAVEFAVMIFPVMLFMTGVVQTGYIVWADNLLHAAVDVAARCGAIPGSTTSPCPSKRSGTPGDLADMILAANAVFAPLSGARFTANTADCNDGSGLIGRYSVSVGFVVDLTLTAKSCYPSVPS